MITDEVILEIAMWIFIYVFFFALGFRARWAHILAGITAIFLGVRILEITGSISLGIIIMATAVMTLLFGLFSKADSATFR